MIIQNNTVVISPASSPSSSSSSSISPSSTDSDWLEVKMETDDSPEPDHSPTQFSPELLPDGSRSSIILTPPSAFADSSLQSQQGTPQQQIRGTPIILKNCGGTFTIPGKLPLSVLQDTEHSPVSSASDTFSVVGGSDPTSGRTVASDCCRVISTQCGADTNASTMHVLSLPQRGTPSIMATSSMMNSMFVPRSPSSAPSSTRRTPVIMATDSVMGNMTLAARSPFSLQPPSASITRCTPSLLVTDSVMGNSTFGVQCLSSAVQSRSGTSETPCILASNSVVGNSTFGAQLQSNSVHLNSTPSERTPSIVPSNFVMGNPTFGIQTTSSTAHSKSIVSDTTSCIIATTSVMVNPSMKAPTSPPQPKLHTPQVAAVHLANENSAGTSVWDGSPDNQQESLCSVTPQTNTFFTPADSEREVDRSEQMMDVTPSLNSTVDDLAECWARMNSFKHHEHELKEELQKIKGKFFDLLNTLGLSHDIYYNAVTPAETPDSRELDPQVIGRRILTAAGSLTQCRGSSRNVSLAHSNIPPTKPARMSTPRSTPRRRNHGRHHGVDMSSKYADLVIEQLLAKAQTESSSSKSNSPTDLQAVAAQDASAVSGVPVQYHHHHQNDGQNNLSPDVNVNRGLEDADTKDSAKTKVIPVFSETGDDDTTLLEHSASANREVHHVIIEPTVSPEVLSSSSGSAPVSSNGSSTQSSVPDLSKELVSRMQYYSDFTIDRQKKIDQVVKTLGAVPEGSDEASPPSPPSKECSSESISLRCVEGSESVDRFKAPLPVSKPLVPAVPARGGQFRVIRRKGKHCPSSSDTNESDTSSGTGSMPRSQQSSRPSSHYSSAHSSKHSSHDRQSARSSSGDHRSSSRGSRCSTHPLASSTFISDPSKSGSPGSGSVYTWSLDNSSDENLHQSFLRSEKRHHKRSRALQRRSKSSHSNGGVASHSVTRPATVIGADSPPHEKLSSVGKAPSFRHDISDIDSTPKRFGGSRFENSLNSSFFPRCSSLPRTSTRIGGLLLRGEGDRDFKTSSSPELTTPYSDLNYAVSRIGPSNLPSTDRSSSPFKDRPDLPGKSSTSDSATSYHSQCITCNPGLVASPASTSIRLVNGEDPCDDILTNSPNSCDSSGVQPPYNSYLSPADSSSEYTTVSNSSAEHSILASAPRQPRSFAVRSPGVFKVPFSPASRTVKRRGGAGGHSTHNVGVRAVGTPHLPVGLLKHKDAVSRRKLFAAGQGQVPSGYHAPKILDRKALVRKFKKFSNNFKKDKDSAKIHTLANL
ncbi:uncharacterized protein LOC143284168 [Babylonia areolata]|uniref:uncharacterized protein LOC143284168 n=1 Tax=Babylonia areolata TaxID=304850 RepID=UPI003FD5392B